MIHQHPRPPPDPEIVHQGQVLINLVRLRCVDAAEFVGVAQIVSSYELRREVVAGSKAEALDGTWKQPPLTHVP